MTNKKILMIAPYPIVNPQHGGQKRAKALFEFYSKHYKHTKFVGVYHRGFYADHGEDDLLLGQADIIASIDSNPHAAELLMGEAIASDIHVRSFMAKLLREYQPDAIHVEQVFPYRGLASLLRDINMQPKLIFGSQNIEYRLKEAIYKETGLSAEVARSLVKQVKELETAFSRDADLVVAVSETDAKEHKRMGARKVVIAPNGIEKTIPTRESLVHWKEFKKQHGVHQAITFVGSGHPPNWMGFLEMVGDDTSFLPEGAKILMAGGVSEYFKHTYKYGKGLKKYSKLWHSILPLGILSEDHLAGLLESSDIILLPIVDGGGSNLKTAEAILTGKWIVASSYAFRGYDKYKNLPNVRIADNPSDFRLALRDAVLSGAVERTPAEVRLAEHVQWQYCLKPLKPAVQKALKAPIKRRIVWRLRQAAKVAKRLLT